MLYEISKELHAALKRQHVPFPVVFGPESMKMISASKEHVAVDYLVNDKRDGFAAPRATHSNPPVLFNWDQAARLHIYARSPLNGAAWADHARRAHRVLRHVLCELDIVLRVTRSNPWEQRAGGFVQLEDDKGSELFNGAVYELDFAYSSSVPRVPWEGDAADEVVLGTDFDLVHKVKVGDEVASEQGDLIMAELPQATTTIDNEAGASAGGTELIAVLAPVATAADSVPRIFASAKALLAKHGYCEGADYCAHHFSETKKQVLFVGMPIVTAGVIGRLDASGNTGSSVVSVAAGGGGVLDGGDFQVKVSSGGIVGTDQIMLSISCDGGRSFKSARLGTALTYTIPYFGFVLTFTTAGTLVTGDIAYKFSASAPRWDQAGLQAAREALAAQQKQIRSILVIGDLVDEDDADDVLTEVNAYESESNRYVFARAQVRDRVRQASMSRVRVRMSGTPTITFAEVGGTGDTITRSAGSFISDGFAVGDVITVSGAVASAGANNVTGPIASLTATVITLGTTDLAAEGPISNVSIVASNALTFAEVGATDDTITRSGGSWLADGFAVGDVVTVAGTASNNVTGAIKTLTATVLTFDTTDLVAEVIGSYGVTITAGESDTDWVTSIDGEFGDVDDEIRIDLGAGRGRKASRIHGYRMRRGVQWAASLREYQHDVQIPTYRKADGKCDGWDLEDAEGNTYEHDERVDGGLLAARFTCFTTWSNGPAGAFIALSLTRGLEGSMLSRTHNLAVANVASSVCQAETENAVGMVVQVKSNGTGEEASLRVLEKKVNSALAIALLQDRPEGPRASTAVWTASRTDVLVISESNPTPTLHGTLELDLNGTIERIETIVKINAAA